MLDNLITKGREWINILSKTKSSAEHMKWGGYFISFKACYETKTFTDFFTFARVASFNSFSFGAIAVLPRS